jgi:hypothetical protein
VISNPIHGEVYSIQHYVIKVCQWFATGLWFSPVSFTNKTDPHNITDCHNITDPHNITEILLKVALNIINKTKIRNIAYSLVHTLKTLAQTSNKTIIATMHQPSSKMFYLCDNLLLLCHGQVILSFFLIF